jgi:RNA polymerase sigma-70 factor (ECF subfamily)
MHVAELIREARMGKAAAQKCLFDLLADKMMMVCCRYVKNEADAEELLLDGFYKFFTRLDSFQYRGDAALYNWIKKIMINECLMFLRKKHAFTIVAETEAEEIPFSEDALNNLSAEEIFKLIVQLPVGYRTVFNLYVVEGMGHAAIAELLGISEGTSKSQLSKAKAVLQKLLNQKEITYVRRQKS